MATLKLAIRRRKLDTFELFHPGAKAVHGSVNQTGSLNSFVLHAGLIMTPGENPFSFDPKSRTAQRRSTFASKAGQVVEAQVILSVDCVGSSWSAKHKHLKYSQLRAWSCGTSRQSSLRLQSDGGNTGD